MDDQFFIWSIIVSTSIYESTVSNTCISNNFPFRDSLKDFFALFFKVAGIPFQILTPTHEKAFCVDTPSCSMLGIL